MARVDLPSVAFDGLALLMLGSASVVAFSRDLVRSAVGLMGTLAGVAGLYMMLSADFLAVAQLLVYAGGTSVLFFLAAVLSPNTPGVASNAPRSRRGAALATMILGVALAVVAAGTIWPVDARPVQVPETAKIGHALLGAYLLPFELASVLLIAALVGALLIARRNTKSGAAT